MTLKSSRSSVLCRGSVSAIALSAVMTAFGPVHAQQSDQAFAGVEEITVTARKREESLQSTPVSVTAFTSSSLEARSIDNLSGIQNFTPNLQINNGRPDGGGSTAQLFIRGVGQNDFLFPNDPGVGLYLDDVYISRSVGGMMSLVDVERIEVLRGPQGTLYGRNTIGGAVKVITNRPDGDVEGRMQVTTGRFDRLDVQGYVAFPIVEDELFGKISVASINRDGYGRRLTDGQQLGDDDKLITRGMLRWVPTDRLDITLAADVTRQREYGAVGTLLGTVPGAAVADPTVGLPFDPTPQDSLTVIDLYNAMVIPAIAPGLGLPADTQFDDRWLTGNPFLSNGTDMARDDLDIWGVSLTVDWDLSDTIMVKSVTAYRDLEASFSRDSDHTPLPIVATANENEQHQFSQELQFSGDAADNRLQWLFGAYYFDEFARDRNNVKLVSGTLQAAGFELDITPLNEIDVKNWALFGQGTYALTDKLSVTVGVRYTYEKKEYFQDHFNTVSGVQVVGPRLLEESWDDFSPRFGLEYQANDDVLLYANASKGFKSGGWSPRPTNGNEGLLPFNPETLWSFEAGAKTAWADNRVVLNTAAFYNLYQDIQLTTVAGGPNGALILNVQNAAENRIWGFEAEVFARPVENLDLQAALGYINDKYTELDPGVTIPEDAELPDAPSWTLNLGAAYTIPLTNSFELTLRGDANYRSRVEKDPINSKTIPVNGNLIGQDGYWLLDARMSFGPQDGPWELAVFGTNLTNKKYITNSINVDAFGFLEAYYGRPREWGASATLRF